jgi:hypothetical protein
MRAIWHCRVKIPAAGWASKQVYDLVSNWDTAYDSRTLALHNRQTLTALAANQVTRIHIGLAMGAMAWKQCVTIGTQFSFGR